jgi:hypothetical protein
MKDEVQCWVQTLELLLLLHKNQTCNTSLWQISQLAQQLGCEMEGLSLIPCCFGLLCQNSKYTGMIIKQPTYLQVQEFHAYHAQGRQYIARQNIYLLNKCLIYDTNVSVTDLVPLRADFRSHIWGSLNMQDTPVLLEDQVMWPAPTVTWGLAMLSNPTENRIFQRNR